MHTHMHTHTHTQGKLIYDESGESYYDGDWVENQQLGWGTRRYRYAFNTTGFQYGFGLILCGRKTSLPEV